MNRNTFVALAALLVGGMAMPAYPQSSYDETELLISKIQTDKRAVVLGGMGLTESEAKAFVPVYDDYQVERKEIYEDSVELVNRFAANAGSMTDDAAADILGDWFKLRDDERELMKKYAKKVEKAVSPTKALRFVQIENKLNAVMDVQAARIIPLAK